MQLGDDFRFFQGNLFLEELLGLFNEDLKYTYSLYYNANIRYCKKEETRHAANLFGGRQWNQTFCSHRIIITFCRSPHSNQAV